MNTEKQFSESTHSSTETKPKKGDVVALGVTWPGYGSRPMPPGNVCGNGLIGYIESAQNGFVAIGASRDANRMFYIPESTLVWMKENQQGENLWDVKLEPVPAERYSILPSPLDQVLTADKQSRQITQKELKRDYTDTKPLWEERGHSKTEWDEVRADLRATAEADLRSQITKAGDLAKQEATTQEEIRAMLELIRTGHETLNTFTDYDAGDLPPAPCIGPLTELGELLVSKYPGVLKGWLESIVREYAGYAVSNCAHNDGEYLEQGFKIIASWIHILNDQWGSLTPADKASMFARRISHISFRSKEMDIVYGGKISMTFDEFQASAQVLAAMPPAKEVQAEK